MIKLSELIKNKVKEITLKSGIVISINAQLNVEEQMGLGLVEISQLPQEQMATKTPEIVFKLISDWNVTDDEGEKLEITLENFKKLPVSFYEMNDILMSCDAFKMGGDEEKKNIEAE